ncbi:MAG TPA: FAD-dependent oxidoreductase [Candidatus Binataceae bacterium]|nr:FAD-dependent oxidoreductase [Candidatus Binataceae bacterium]
MASGGPPAASRERPNYQARVERIFDHCADTRSLFLRMVNRPLPRFSPGMFISVAIPLANETRLRPYTIATSPEDGEPFELCFNLVPNGPGAAWMFNRRAGDVLDFTGPFGAFTLEESPEREAVFIAEGTAIAPVRPMIRRALVSADGPPIHLVYAADRPDHLLYRDELEGLARSSRRFTFEPTVIEGGPDSLHGRLLEIAQTRWVAADSNRSRQFFVAGVGGGVLKLRDLLRGSGYERRAVRYEQW